MTRMIRLGLVLLIFFASILKAENKKEKNVNKLQMTPKKTHFQVRSQCKIFKTYRMKQLCNRIAADPNLVAMGRQARAFARSKDEQKYSSRIRGRSSRTSNARGLVVDWTGFTVPPISARSLPTSGFQCDKSCPTHSTIMSAKAPMLRSFSPWRSCTHYDPLRFPQWLKLGFCSCKGCINPKTKKEDRSFVSEPINITMTVLKREPHLSFSECRSSRKGCLKDTVEVTIGCTCVLPEEV